MNNSDMPAMPTAPIWIDCSDDPIKSYSLDSRGLTKREYFAALAMQALLSDSTRAEQKGYDVSLSQLADDAVAQSDALLSALGK